MNFAKFLRKPFLQNTSGRLLLYIYRNPVFFNSFGKMIYCNNLIPAVETFFPFSESPATTFIFLSSGNVLSNEYCITISGNGFSD